MNTSLEQLKQDIFKYAEARLGGGIVDIELDPEHYEIAYQRALGTYRQRSSNSSEESYAWLELQENVSTYTLPQEVSQVRQIFRRSFTSSASGTNASSFDAFSAAYTNNYLLNYGRVGSLLTYELYTQYQELSSKMFGGNINFTFNPASKVLNIVRDPKSTGEIVVLWTYNLKPEVQLLTDPSTAQWIKDFTYSACKQIVGEARDKFQSIAGPNGGGSLNGSSLKNEAAQEIDKLIEDLKLHVDGAGTTLTWVMG